MRDIKFRAWDEKRKHYLGNWEYVINPDDGKVFEQVGYNPEYEKFSVNYNAVAEQYTGLHDKNSKEIYEGDIVRLHVVVLSPYDSIGYIEYRPDFGYCVNFRKSIARQEYWAGNDRHTIEVIGNIHENKEFLDGGNDKD